MREIWSGKNALAVWGMKVLRVYIQQLIIAEDTNYKSGNDDIQCDIHENWDYDAWVFEIDTLDTTDIIDNQYANNAVKVYPNPAKEYVVLECPLLQAGGHNGDLVLITDVFGRKVAEMDLKGGKTVWDCREVERGIYLYRITTGTHSEGGKLIIE